MIKGLIIGLVFIVLCAISWGLTVGFVKLITLCFAIDFSFKIATGIWLILFMLNLAFYKSKKEARDDEAD